MSLLDRVQKQQGPDPNAVPEGAYVPQANAGGGIAARIPAAARTRSTAEMQIERIKNRLQARLIDDLDNRGRDEEENAAQTQERIITMLNAVLAELGISMTKPERERLQESVLSDFLGLGPIDPLINDPSVTEVMVNGPEQVFIEQKGKLTLSNVTFESEGQLRRVIDRIVSTIGRRIDESSPMVDARLKDGSRVNVIIPPLSLNGPILTIRKFSKDPYKINDLIKFGTITEPMAQFLRACVRARLNMLVSGGTGSGKTTTLNVLSSFIPEDERVVTVEDAAELQLIQEHVVTLESRPATVEGRGRIAIRDLVVNALRMRPDRIVVGECRGGEALDMLQAMNTGHDGSLTTIHANSPRDSLNRLETLVLMAGAELPSRAIREQISSAINVIVQQSRLRDGTRKIIAVSEVLGLHGDQVKTQDIFIFKQTGVTEAGKVLGYFTPTGIIPKYFDHLQSSGEGVPKEIFTPVQEPALKEAS
jgi:pilus assembly protein CpaF